jgi:hypothetical protein
MFNYKRGGYQPQPGPRPNPPGHRFRPWGEISPEERRDMSAAKAAWSEFQIGYIKRHGGKSIKNFFGVDVSALARMAFFGGWHARKRIDHIVAYGGDPTPTTADPRVAETVLRTILAEGPVAVEKIRELAGFAGVSWPAMLRAGNKIATPWRWPCVSVTHWELRDPENDFDSFLDAGIPNG